MAVYTGFVNKDDKPHGPGVKTIHTGQVQDCDGPGMALTPNADGSLNADQERYEDQYKDGEKHGHGYCVYSSGNRYFGKWSYDNKQGHGMFTFTASGNTYTGSWKDNKRHGKGKYTWENGTTD